MIDEIRIDDAGIWNEKKFNDISLKTLKMFSVTYGDKMLQMILKEPPRYQRMIPGSLHDTKSLNNTTLLGTLAKPHNH